MGIIILGSNPILSLKYEKFYLLDSAAAAGPCVVQLSIRWRRSEMRSDTSRITRAFDLEKFRPIRSSITTTYLSLATRAGVYTPALHACFFSERELTFTFAAI